MEHISLWWIVFARLWLGAVGWIFCLRALRRLRDEKVIREALGRNGMESFVLWVVILCVRFIAWSLFLTFLNAVTVLPEMPTQDHTPRRVSGALILCGWAASGVAAGFWLMRLMPRLREMAREQLSKSTPPEAA